MISALIDVGSNTIRMSIYEYTNNEMTILLTKKEMVGLIKYVKEKEMSKEGIDKAIDTLMTYKQIITNFHINDVHVFATASLRNITNTKEVLQKIEEATTFNIDIISSDQEARLEFVGASKNVVCKNGVLVDIGGGSSEVVLFHEGNIEQAISMNIGSLNMYTKYVQGILPTKKEANKIKECVERELNYYFKNIDKNKYPVICGVGGSIRATNKLYIHEYGLMKTNYKMNYKKMNEMYKLLIEKQEESIHKILDVVPERCKTILIGMIIFKTIVKFFECSDIVISKYGVREGYFYTRVVK